MPFVCETSPFLEPVESLLKAAPVPAFAAASERLSNGICHQGRVAPGTLSLEAR